MVSDRRIFIHFLLTSQAVTAGFAILDPLYAFPWFIHWRNRHFRFTTQLTK